MQLNNLISGEKLQSIADATILISENCNLPFFEKNKIKSVSKDDITEIKKLKKIFVYTHDLKYFFDNIYPNLENFILISHNSDYGIDAEFLKYLNEDKIIKWYSQNCYIEHDKLEPIPIGIANSRWPHGNLDALLRIKSIGNEKKYLVYNNFNNETNLIERQSIETILNLNKIPKDSKRTFDEYLDFISKSVFCIAPPGNGKDCHRIWECLYLDTVPVVKYDIAFSRFKDLPILFFNSWNDLTPDFFKQVFKDKGKLKNYYHQKMDFQYWYNSINSL